MVLLMQLLHFPGGIYLTHQLAFYLCPKGRGESSSLFRLACVSKQRSRFMTVVDEFLQANEEYASHFQKGDLPLPPARILGLEEGDAHVIRNAGGRAADALRSLVISEQLLGTNTIVIIHHTDCGMLTFTNEQIHDKVKRDLSADADHIAFLPFKDLEQSVRDDIAFLRNSPLIPQNIDIRGFIYDVKTGKLQPVA